MADKSEIFHFELGLVDEACALDEQLKLTLARHPSETHEHCLMRVMAYVLFWQPGIQMGGAVCQGDEPDLKVEQHAVIVGINNHKHVRKCAKHHPRLTCLEWRQQHINKATDLCQLIDGDDATATIIGVQGDTEKLLSNLKRRNRWQVTLSDDQVIVYSGAEQFVFYTRTLCRL